MTARGNPGTRRACAALVGAVALALAATGCAGGADPSADGDGVRGPVTVFAAASLTESFTRLGAEFEAAHPGTTVTFSFAGSSALATQVNQGAPADVFAAASPATMRTVTDAGNADGPPVVFARNQLVIAVPQGNPRSVAGLADLTRPGTKVALCAPQVPCGAAARTALDAAGVPLTPVTLEQDVKGALSKLRLGEVDAALVYRTDAAASEVDAVEFPESAGAVNDYPIVVLRQAGNPAAAREFVAYVRSDRGRAALTAAGFQPPRA
ncbi:molybdate ABC transporter substrate-binding protein [Micromonospora rubida]|uniref:molybdate ABC transporter substrate-binding protein n=1 Tax=Micromonospora rubida TaxID=2697657 RepID=UPI0038B25515